jgi:hypothetical protein
MDRVGAVGGAQDPWHGKRRRGGGRGSQEITARESGHAAKSSPNFLSKLDLSWR